jgi:hypothetical protein
MHSVERGDVNFRNTQNVGFSLSSLFLYSYTSYSRSHISVHHHSFTFNRLQQTFNSSTAMSAASIFGGTGFQEILLQVMEDVDCQTVIRVMGVRLWTVLPRGR